MKMYAADADGIGTMAEGSVVGIRIVRTTDAIPPIQIRVLNGKERSNDGNT